MRIELNSLRYYLTSSLVFIIVAQNQQIQKSKDDKLKQRELEREENHKRYVQEQERKRLEQKKRLLQAQKLALEKKPIYMTTQQPMLASDDYDSDDPNYRKVECPSWCTGQYFS